MGWWGGVGSYPLSSQAPTPVEVELGCDNYGEAIDLNKYPVTIRKQSYCLMPTNMSEKETKQWLHILIQVSIWDDYPTQIQFMLIYSKHCLFRSQYFQIITCLTTIHVYLVCFPLGMSVVAYPQQDEQQGQQYYPWVVGMMVTRSVTRMVHIVLLHAYKSLDLNSTKCKSWRAGPFLLPSFLPSSAKPQFSSTGLRLALILIYPASARPGLVVK